MHWGQTRFIKIKIKKMDFKISERIYISNLIASHFKGTIVALSFIKADLEKLTVTPVEWTESGAEIISAKEVKGWDDEKVIKHIDLSDITKEFLLSQISSMSQKDELTIKDFTAISILEKVKK